MVFPPGVSIALTLGKVIAGYSGYKKGRNKEDDLALRQRLSQELDKSRGYLLNFLEESYIENETTRSMRVQAIIDLIDNLKKEVNLASSGHKYALFSQQYSISTTKMKKLIQYDASVIEKSMDLNGKLEKLGSSPLEGAELDFELKTIKNDFVTLQGSFRDRIEYLKGMKK